MTPIADNSKASLAAAAGWLAGRGLSLLGDRSYLNLVIVWHYRQGGITIENLHQLETDLTAACVKVGIRAPRVEVFFRCRRQ